MVRIERRLEVFIASPGDCSTQREIVRQAIRWVDRVVGRQIGLRLEPVDYENFSYPTAGRPQDVINPLVDASDVLVGLLWHRIGTDGGNGMPATIEELFRGLERYHAEGQPRLMLYFNLGDVDVSKVNAQQLVEVRKFREDLDARKQLYYGTFSTDDELDRKLRESLIHELFLRLPDLKPPADPAADFASAPAEAHGGRRRDVATGSAPEPTPDKPPEPPRVPAGSGALENHALAQAKLAVLRSELGRLQVMGTDSIMIVNLKTEIARIEAILNEALDTRD